MIRAGVIESIWRHPVKSMRGERVAEAAVRWAGLAGDRRYSFVRGDDPSQFPWLTARIQAELLRYQPSFADPTDPGGSAVRVRIPSGDELAVDDPALLAELAARYRGPVHLLHSSRGLHDAAPLSLIGRPSVEALCVAQGLAPELRRFRNNFVIVGDRGVPFEEDSWIGRELILGEGSDAPRIRIDRRNERCMMITLEPETLERAPGLHRALVAERANCAGVYASVVVPGLVRENATIFFS